MNFMEKSRRCREFIEALDEERKKIEVFQRELPLCLHLINQTIDSYKKLMVADDLISSDEPVMKEFISLKPSTDTTSVENVLNDQVDTGRKLNWMNSEHLWTQESVQQPKQDLLEKPIAVRAKRSWGAEIQHLDKKDKDNVELPDSSEALGSSSVEVAHSVQIEGNDAGSEGEGKEEKSQPKRKMRRCWSEELHNKFLQVIQQLGGCHVATPKQIRDLMMEDGLTNDEVKSHLQKYRLHTRRTNSAAQNSNNNSVPAQFVVVSGIWIPQPPEYM